MFYSLSQFLTQMTDLTCDAHYFIYQFTCLWRVIDCQIPQLVYIPLRMFILYGVFHRCDRQSFLNCQDIIKAYPSAAKRLQSPLLGGSRFAGVVGCVSGLRSGRGRSVRALSTSSGVMLRLSGVLPLTRLPVIAASLC